MYLRSVNATCYSAEDGPQLKHECKRFPHEGTTAILDCLPGFSGDQQSTECQANGNWEPKPQNCQLICGKGPVVVGSGHTETSHAPWKAVIFVKNDTTGEMVRLGSGIILNERITVASVVGSNDHEYAVAVGSAEGGSMRYYAIITVRHNDHLYLYATRRQIILSDHVTPICLPAEKHFAQFDEKFPNICNGLNSEEVHHELGEALIFPRSENGTERYYIQGILSESKAPFCTHFIDAVFEFGTAVTQFNRANRLKFKRKFHCVLNLP